MTEWVMATCHPAHARPLRDRAERAGLTAVVVPAQPPVYRAVPDDEVVAESTAGGLAVTDYFVVAGALCFINVNGDLMARVIEDPALAAATRAHLRSVGAREYASYQEYVTDHRRVVGQDGRPEAP